MDNISPPRPGLRPRWTAEAIRSLGLHTNVSTAADILGISRSTAYDLIARDQFPTRVLRMGRRLVIPTFPLLELLTGSAGDDGEGR